MRVIVFMQTAHMNPTRADTHTWESVQTCGRLLICQRLVGVQVGRPHAEDARARLKAT